MNDSDLQRDYQRAVALRKSLDRRHCPSSEALEGLAAGVGSERDRLTTLDHTMACSYCQREFELLRAIHAAGAEPRVLSAPRRWYALAAVAVLAVALTLFTVNRDASTLRGTSADELPLLVSPSGALDAASSRLFVWRAFPGAAQYRIELLEPGGRLRASASVFDTSWSLPDSVVLTPGETLQWTVDAIMPDARRVQSSIGAFRVR